MATDLGFATNVKIGANADSIEDVKIEPHVEYLPSSEVGKEKLGCGNSQWFGAPRCRWTYPDRLLTGEQFYQLKNLVGDAPSAPVVIDIPTQDLSITTYTPIITTYQATMHWPLEGVTIIHTNRWQIPDDGIMFTNLEPL